jgi:hypothetical protein
VRVGVLEKSNGHPQHVWMCVGMMCAKTTHMWSWMFVSMPVHGFLGVSGLLCHCHCVTVCVSSLGKVRLSAVYRP